MTKTFTELMSAIAQAKKSPPRIKLKMRVAIIGGYSFYPLNEMLSHLLAKEGVGAEIFLGEFGGDRAEILDVQSRLHKFRPEVTIWLPGAAAGRYEGKLSEEPNTVKAAIKKSAKEILNLAVKLHDATGSEVLLGNFAPEGTFDLGPARGRLLTSDWMFRRALNLELGLRAPSFVHICDLEFLYYRFGSITAHDRRGWFESKQAASPDLLVALAHELSHQINKLKEPAKKVIAIDLDNTVWGGVIGDDGLSGIELGDTSPRGEAFKEFQRFISSLKERGFLLAVSSKNDLATAREPFEKHPESILKMKDFVSFQANWAPKTDQLRAIASELNLGLDSFVFIDDNPAEIELIRQTLPEVSTVLLPEDPADFVTFLQDTRFLEITSLTAEDARRTELYRANASGRRQSSETTDLNSYLKSLKMRLEIQNFREVDLPRIAQLVGKSNQFNLTTIRRSEAELRKIAGDKNFQGFSVRLNDRLADHGLIAVVILEKKGTSVVVDSWLMSCRVLSRGVEEETLNEIFRRAKAWGAKEVVGRFQPTAKNALVADLYRRFGFSDQLVFKVDSFKNRPTQIGIKT